MFVTPEDFEMPPLVLPNIRQNGSFQEYIDEKEAEVLRDLLGASFYESFLIGLAALPAVWEPAPISYSIGDKVVYGLNVYESITDLNSGNNPSTDMEVNWQLYETGNTWLKLRDGFTYSYRSRPWSWLGIRKMLKPYIYASWISDNHNPYMGVGVTGNAKTENSTSTNPKNRIVRYYNEFARMAGSECQQGGGTLYGYLANTADDTFDSTFDDSFETFTDYLRFSFNDPGRLNTFNL